MNPLVELQKLLKPKKLQRKELGTVVHVTDTLVHVVVNGKQRIVAREGGSYVVGDEVSMQGDTVLSRKRRVGTVNEYIV